jgi:hypothetical protein
MDLHNLHTKSRKRWIYIYYIWIWWFPKTGDPENHGILQSSHGPIWNDLRTVPAHSRGSRPPRNTKCWRSRRSNKPDSAETQWGFNATQHFTGGSYQKKHWECKAHCFTGIAGDNSSWVTPPRMVGFVDTRNLNHPQPRLHKAIHGAVHTSNLGLLEFGIPNCLLVYHEISYRSGHTYSIHGVFHSMFRQTRVYDIDNLCSPTKSKDIHTVFHIFRFPHIFQWSPVFSSFL